MLKTLNIVACSYRDDGLAENWVRYYSVPTRVYTPGSLYTPIEKLAQILSDPPVICYPMKLPLYLYSGKFW
jgi:hypothetical protein